MSVLIVERIVERIAIVRSLRGITLMISMMLISAQLLAQPQRKEHVVEHPTFYRTEQIDGLSIFYREAGPKNAPTILLLHGLPSSSRMFEPLFKRLSDRYHLVAPDYPGFGHSDWPDPKKFAYTFESYAEIMNRFTEGLGANWKTRRAFWADRAANESALRTNLLSLQTTRTRHVGNDPNVERYDA